MLRLLFTVRLLFKVIVDAANRLLSTTQRLFTTLLQHTVQPQFKAIVVVAKRLLFLLAVARAVQLFLLAKPRQPLAATLVLAPKFSAEFVDAS